MTGEKFVIPVLDIFDDLMREALGNARDMQDIATLTALISLKAGSLHHLACNILEENGNPSEKKTPAYKILTKLIEAHPELVTHEDEQLLKRLTCLIGE